MAMVMGEMISKFQECRDGAYEDAETRRPHCIEPDDETPPECNKCLCGISPRAWAVIVAVLDMVSQFGFLELNT